MHCLTADLAFCGKFAQVESRLLQFVFDDRKGTVVEGCHEPDHFQQIAAGVTGFFVCDIPASFPGLAQACFGELFHHGFGR